jgi:hypothetical protein
VEEARNGAVIYANQPDKFHEWEFKVRMRAASSKKDDIPQTMAKIVDGLRGEALEVARSVGAATLLSEVGADKIIEAIKARMFPIARTEARELLQQG